VESDLLLARDAVDRDDSMLVVVGHSLGGVIAYDLLTAFRPDIEVDLLVTVGSQVALLEELTLLASPSDPSVPGRDTPRVPRPPNLRAWLNVFDETDLLGFQAGSVFEGVSDHRYQTGAIIGAHGRYLDGLRFHRRLLAGARDVLGATATA
jgi:pimeloyl-ACP methyl ester carboxylesterase